MGALIWAQLALLASGSATVEIRTDANDSWRARALEVVAEDALADASWHWSGELSGEQVSYSVRRAENEPVIASGTIELSNRKGFASDVAGSVRGLDPIASGPSLAEAPARAPPLGALLFILLVAGLIIASPLLVFARSILGSPLAALRERSSIRWTVFCWAVLALAYISAINLEALANADWIAYVIGGLAWGLFVSANGRIVLPAFSGLGRVEHRDVFRLIGAWLWVALLRAVRRTVFYAPFMAALWLAATHIDLSARLLFMVAVPVWGLMVRFWFLSIIENATLALDKRLVLGPADEDNPWHVAIRGYFLGYVNRLGWPDGAALARDVLFLPGDEDGVTVYGGGLTRSRIVIGRQLLEFGLAPYGRPHDYEAPREDKLFWSDWHVGLVVPSKAKTIASREARVVTHHAEPGDDEPPLNLGQPPTLAGFVEPSALDTRHSHRPAEDPTWLEWDPGNDFDGTDPGDHDFLFGALVVKLGKIQRHADQRQTLVNWLAPAANRTPSALRRALRVAAAPYRLAFERPQTELGDAFAAVNFAKHHLLQFLAWETWRDDGQLTSRALAPELERQTGAIIGDLEAEEETDRDPRSPRARMRSLATFTTHEVTRSIGRWRRRLPVLATTAIVASVIAWSVIRAINYHPTYLEAIAESGDSSEQGPTDQ